MTEATSDDIRIAAQPKSDQLNADDLIAGPMTFKIEAVSKGDTPDKVFIDIGLEGRPWKPCKGMIRILLEGWSINPRDWVGKSVTLFRNPRVKYSGEELGGIEISHMSHIGKTHTFQRTVRRGKKAPYVVMPLDDAPALTEDEQSYIADATAEINAAETMEELKSLWFIVNTKSDLVKAALLPVKDDRKSELEAG